MVADDHCRSKEAETKNILFCSVHLTNNDWAKCIQRIIKEQPHSCRISSKHETRQVFVKSSDVMIVFVKQICVDQLSKTNPNSNPARESMSRREVTLKVEVKKTIKKQIYYSKFICICFEVTFLVCVQRSI